MLEKVKKTWVSVIENFLTVLAVAIFLVARNQVFLEA